jgi:carbon monoxide dehydrogenase subunit G
MTTFKSPEVIINKTSENFFNKISDLNNLKDILPSQIEEFESSETTCSFKISGMPKLKLEITEKEKFSKITLTAKESQIAFTLDCFILEKGEKCQARLEINAELNMMMKMMVTKPLTQLLDKLASKMQNI